MLLSRPLGGPPRPPSSGRLQSLHLANCMGRVDMGRGTAWGNVTICSPHRHPCPCPSDGGERAAAGPERHGSPSEPRLVSSGGAPTAQPQNGYSLTSLPTEAPLPPGLRSPRFSRCDAELGDRLVGPLELWRPRLHLSSDIWAAFLWQNWNSRCDPSVCFVRSFVAYDFPFTCLYIKVQTLDSVRESALWPCYCAGVS